MILNELKPQDDLYFQGAFWIIADSFENIMKKKNISIIRKRIDEEIEKEENWKANIQRKLSNPKLKECKRKELQKELEKHEETMQIVSNYKKHYR